MMHERIGVETKRMLLGGCWPQEHSRQSVRVVHLELVLPPPLEYRPGGEGGEGGRQGEEAAGEAAVLLRLWGEEGGEGALLLRLWGEGGALTVPRRQGLLRGRVRGLLRRLRCARALEQKLRGKAHLN
jgi:hypothetical protein